MTSVLRITRPSDDHDGFGGISLGHPGAPYHHLPERPDWEAAVARMRGQGFAPVPAFNPYWERAGVTFEDPDGYRVVLQNGGWKV